LYHGGNMVDMNTLLATNSTTGLNKAFSINDRGQILCLGSNLQTGKGDVYLYDNGSAVRVKDLFDDASWTNLQYGMGFKVINDAGQIGWIATSSNGTSHVVVLTPAVEFVREKTPGCGWFVNVDKAGLPVFQPDSGIGRGPAPMPTGITAIDLMLQENLSNDAVGGMYVSCENSVGSFSGLLRETAPASGVFTNGDGSFTVTLNPVVQTSGNQVDVLDITVSSQGQALTNLALIAQETDTNSLEFANVIPHAELDMTGPFASNTVSTIQLQLDTNWDPTDFDGALTETAPNSLVFTSATGNVTLTVNNFTGLSLTQQDVMAVTISNTMMTAKHFTLTLTETTPNSQHFSNFGIRQVTDITPVTPDVSGEGVFYVRTHGSSTGTNAINIKLKTDTEEITVPAIRLSNTTTYMTGKLLVVPAGASVSYSGITVIHDDPTSIVASRVDIPLSQTTNTLVRQAFVGRGDDIWYGLHISNGGHFDIIEQLLRANLHYTVRRNLTVTLATVVSELPSNSVWYCFAHGATLHGSADEPFLGFNVWQSESWRSWSAAGITPAIVANAIGTNSYTMVFINGCLSADPSEGSNAGAMASAFRAKAYVGWTKEVRDGVALRAAETFFNALVTTNVEGAISIAQPYPGDDTMPQLRVIGDGSVRIDLTNPR
jgi:hypothetical protein